jgi:hypothetical protein
MATITSVEPTRPKSTTATPSATRFSGSAAICPTGRTIRYTTLVSTYKTVTSRHPSSSARGSVRRQSWTSSATKVTVYQAS